MPRDLALSYSRIGPYEIDSRLGTGGMGTVYLAKSKFLDEFVAIKALRDDRATDQRAIDRFMQEMRAVGRLPHKHRSARPTRRR